ncbi:HAD family phosphatase [Kiritimatiellota bacterium B12222]|nr:HAD family phosphatase [Kiritimatiellota bacterium B12222]
MSTRKWAALFDWDGVIIDSAKAHEKSWEQLASEAGKILPADHFLRGFGMRNEVIIPELLLWTQDPAEITELSLRKEELYREVITSEGVEVLPGVREYLQSLLDAHIPTIVGTSTQRANVELIFECMGLAPFFQAVVSSEDVSRGKPDPEVFLKAANKAQIPANDCVVFEDAIHGIEAAKAGGMSAIGVLTTHPDGGLPGADKWVHRLDDLPLDGSYPL